MTGAPHTMRPRKQSATTRCGVGSGQRGEAYLSYWAVATTLLRLFAVVCGGDVLLDNLPP